jgi:hypothetical protein
MSKFKRVAGYVWAAPLTLFGLIYVTLFTLFGWYKRIGTFDDALVWQLVPEKAPRWLNNAWRSWGGHTIGNVVVMKSDVVSDRGKILLRHEQEHVHQCMVLGIFQPIIYGLAYIGLKFCRHAHAYYDNPFEIDARRAAGQVIDIVGALKILTSRSQLNATPKKLS